jgi:hypothetical protein
MAAVIYSAMAICGAMWRLRIDVELLAHGEGLLIATRGGCRARKSGGKS